jgi:hypothetical protein
MGLFNSTVLDVAIGLVFVYLLLSILCTAANEWLAALTKSRSKFLKKGLIQLLDNQPTMNGGSPDEFINEFYRHPLITGMMKDGKHPAYLSARTFAGVVSDLLVAHSPTKANESADKAGESSDKAIADLEKGVIAMPEGDVQKALSALVKLSKREAITTQEALEAWFNDTMDRVTGWYKRRTQTWTLIVAISITLFANANTIGIARRLWTDPVLRSAVVEEAKVRAQKPPPSVTIEYPDPDDPGNPQATTNADSNVLSEKERDLLGQMLGWHENPFWDKDGMWLRWDWSDWLERLIGWLLTVLALSLGAPFWFDLLNKIINIRSAGKSPDEKAKGPEKEESPARA